MLLNAHARVILQNERITLGGNSVVPSHFKDWFKMNERPLLAPTLKVGRKRKSVQERAEVKRKCEERRNLSRINIGSTIDRWRKLQGDLGLKTDAETADFLLSR